MTYRNKTYVAFDGDSDMHYYNLMKAWRAHDGLTFNFYDAHDLNTARDSSLESSIKAQLSARMQNSKTFVLLVGESTRYLYKFVKWEIEQAINRRLPIIVVNLNRTNGIDEHRCPPILRQQLAVHVPFNQSAIEHALKDWPEQHPRYAAAGNTGPFFYQHLSA